MIAKTHEEQMVILTEKVARLECNVYEMQRTMNSIINNLSHEFLKNALADRKTESDSEKPNNCETCKHNDKKWYELPCDYCCGAHSGYEPKDEPQKRTCANCKHLKKHNGKLADWVCDKKGAVVTNPLDRECDEMWERKDEPQTDCAWGKGEEQ